MHFPRRVQHWRRALTLNLLAKGASFQAKNRRGAQALHYAVDASPDTAHLLCSRLVEAGADPDASAARAQQREIIPTRLRHGARPTDEDKAGKSVLKSAAGKWIIAVGRDLIHVCRAR